MKNIIQCLQNKQSKLHKTKQLDKFELLTFVI